VTVAIGFLCSDGVVVCSDRQMTSDAGFKYEKRKLGYMAGIFHGIRFTLISAYAGDPDAAKIMRSLMFEHLGRKIAESRMNGVLSLKAHKALGEIFRTRDSKGLQMLIGIRFESGVMCLFRTSGRKVVEGRMEHVGSGGDTSALRYLCGFLFPQMLNVREAQILGSYVVSISNRYVDGCSGGPDIFTIRSDGSVSRKPDSEACGEKIMEWEKEMGTILRKSLLSRP